MSDKYVGKLDKKKKSQERIEKVFVQLIQDNEINEISVSDICKLADVNRSTFYANYMDIYDLADTIKKSMFYNVLDLYRDEVDKQSHSYDYLPLFRHIKENQIYYRTMFKLNFDFMEFYNETRENNEAIKFFGTTDHIEYHIEFFKAGMNAILRKWLSKGCIESPEEIDAILKSEYKKRNI